MRALIIAAGRGSRLEHFTNERPKCMVEVAGSSILDHQLKALRAHGMTELHIIRGALADRLLVDGAQYHANPQWERNNILHSLFCAGEAFEGPCVTSYSDIVYTPEVVEAALASTFDVGLVIDRQWARAYEGREDHPPEQAELALVDDQGRVRRVGKSVRPEQGAMGEFIGFASYSKRGAQACREVWADVRARLGDEDPFQDAALFRRAYLTDLFNEMIDRGLTIGAVPIDGGWREIDTVEDLKRVGEHGW